MERLDKIISNLGYGSRKDVKSFVKKGLIEVDGVIAKDNGMAVDPEKSVIKISKFVAYDILNYFERFSRFHSVV